jgi:hypothetical protein
MTGTDAQVPGDPADGPLSLEILADLHAGVLDEDLAATLRRRIATDPHAGTVLAALDATVADLVALPRQRTVRMPDEVALRLDAALAAEAGRNGGSATRRPPASAESAPGPPASPVLPEFTRGPGRVPDIPPTPTTDFTARRRRLGWVGAGLLAAAAATVGIVALSGVQWQTAGTPRAADALGTATGVHPAPPLTLTRATLGSALGEARNSREFGPLSPPTKLHSCLAANGVGAGGAPIGALEVTLDGQPGILLVLTTGQLAEFRLLVVGPECGPGNPSQLANSVVSGR